jgi:hypothetical protein
VYEKVKPEEVTNQFEKKMDQLHSKILSTCSKNQACALRTFADKRINKPKRTLWGKKKWASVLVERKRDEKGLDDLPDWRFHLGFGHRFIFDESDPSLYFCMGFTYSDTGREKSVIVFVYENQRKSAIQQFSITQLLPNSQIPRIVGSINNVDGELKNRFFSAVEKMFSPGFVMPKTHKAFDTTTVFLL